jgi:hypothetical protein
VLVPRPIPTPRLPEGAENDGAEEDAEKLPGIHWEQLVQAVASAFVAYRQYLQMAMVVGTLISFLALSHVLGSDWVEGAPKGRAASKGVQTASKLLQSSPERPASAILSLGTPAATARAAKDADLIGQSGVSALRALAGRTPVRIGGNMAGILRDFAQSTPTSVDSQEAGGIGD